MMNYLLPPLFASIFICTTSFSQVGVGTTNPQDSFHVDGNSDNNTSGTPSNTQEINDFVVDNEGKIGIGTIDPQGKLHIATDGSQDIIITRFSNTLSNDVDIDFVRGTGTVASPNIVTATDTEIGGIRFRPFINPFASDPFEIFPPSAEILARTDGTPTTTSAPGKLIFMTTPSGSIDPLPRMIINNAGNVAIGNSTFTSGTRLEVTDGDIRVTNGSFIDDGTTITVPDYVFEKVYHGHSKLKEDYILLSLEQIEAYTKEHHSLPGVQTALDAQENGWDISKASKVNLEKIEELYLYTIQQNKKILELEKEILQLKEDISRISTEKP